MITLSKYTFFTVIAAYGKVNKRVNLFILCAYKFLSMERLIFAHWTWIFFTLSVLFIQASREFSKAEIKKKLVNIYLLVVITQNEYLLLLSTSDQTVFMRNTILFRLYTWNKVLLIHAFESKKVLCIKSLLRLKLFTCWIHSK